MARYYYTREENATSEELILFHSDWDIERVPEYVAQDAAKDCMDDAGSDLADPRDWPITFFIYDGDKQLRGVYSVEMEYCPNFYAHKM